MDLKTYLIETFQFNSRTNKKLLKKIHQLPDQSECIRLFSHLISSQYKWLARIRQDPRAPGMSWWEPVYPFSDLEKEWDESLNQWLEYIQQRTEDELSKEVEFTGHDGGRWAASTKDIALQLNYHSIHHRAQIQMLIRTQGFEPDFVDYIGTKYRKIREAC